jgi:hypothetical protein
MIVMTLICLALMVALGVAIPEPTQSQESLMENIDKAFFGCLGVVVGALGGKLA